MFGADRQDGQRIDTEFLVIGAGPAGISLSTTLAKEGKSVLLADAGGEKFNAETQSYYKSEVIHPDYPDTTKSRLRQLGGTSNHWANNTSRFSPIDFEHREWLTIPGWPIQLKDIEPYYSKAEFLCGVGGDGYDVETVRQKMGIESPITEDNPFISLGIARAAIPPTRFYSKQKETIKKLENITLLPHAEFIELIFDREQKRAVGGKFFMNGAEVNIFAQTVVLCMGGIENARVLLAENERHNNMVGNQGDAVGRYFMDHPTMQAANLFALNSSLFESFKGRLNADYTQFVVAFYQLSDACIRDNGLSNIRMPLEKSTRMEMSEGISSLHSLRNILSGKGQAKYALQHLSQVALEWDLVAQAALNKLNGPQLIKDADQLSGYQINLMMEQSPHKDSRILLSSQRDNLGRPLAKIDWRLMQSDVNRLWRGLEKFASGIAFDGVGRVKLLKHQADRIFSEQMGFGHHHMGSTRMSDTPEFGVVNKDLRVHGVDNLYVCGSSVFSTGSHVPPTLTITALSLRLADHLLGKPQ